MAIARSFREGWLTSMAIDALRSDGAELFLFRLALRADKNGVYHGEPELLRAAVYPTQLPRRRVSEVARFRDICAKAGLLRMWVNAADGRPYVQILKFRQKTPNERRVHPLPPGEPDDTGQESLALEKPPDVFSAAVNGMKGNSPQSPPPAGGSDASRVGLEPRRRKRLPSLEVLREELALVRQRIGEIRRPGGCAYDRRPEEMGAEKRAEFEGLLKQEMGLMGAIDRTRGALAAA